MHKLWPETGESLAIVFQNTDPIVFVFFILISLATISKRVSKAIFLDIKSKRVGLWCRYILKQGKPLQNLKITNQIVFVLSPDLFFHLIYQKGYQRWDPLRLNEYVGLWGRYILKQGNTLYFFQNTNPIIFVTFVSLLFDLLYQRGYQR